MKIGIVLYPTFGGSGVVATELGIALANKGCEVHFITYKQPVRLDLLTKNVHYHEVFVEEYPLFHYQPYELALSTKLVDIADRFNLDLLHVHYAIPHAYAAYMAQKMLLEKGKFLPFVTTLHGTDITLVGSHPSYKRAVEFSINNSNAVTAVSDSLRNDTLRLFDIHKEINVVYNFIDINKYPQITSDECDRSLLADNNERIITHISNFRPVKRVDDVIKIFEKIQKQIPSKLLLVGDGPEKEKMEHLCNDLKIDKKVVFFGNSNEVNKILCYSDLFLLPSQTESFGLAALEAMAARTPVISTNAGGLPEVNLHGITGFLSDVGNIDEMAKNALLILKNEEILNKFKDKAKSHSEKFTLNHILPQYIKIYESILKEKVNCV
jgi:N-acetyl-alpha-D-glucosaminyl L-malate synthase BshA